jgi:hypothetical protein
MEAQSPFLQFQAELPRSIRRAIWVAAKAGIVLSYIGLTLTIAYGQALWNTTGDFSYSFISVIAVTAMVYLNLPPDKESPDEDTTQPLPPIT